MEKEKKEKEEKRNSWATEKGKRDRRIRGKVEKIEETVLITRRKKDGELWKRE